MDEDLQPLLSLRARRRLLVALGYGAANVTLAGIIGWRPHGRPNPTATMVDLTSAMLRGLPPSLPDAGPEPAPSVVHDLVVSNGRVMDPASGFDGLANVGIDGSVVTAISAEPLQGRELIDATNRVVAPGFVDLLSYEPNSFGAWFKLADGVTTNLAMHGVNNYAESFFGHYEHATPIHFGGAFHQHFMRAEIGAGVEDPLTPEQLDQFEQLLRKNLAAGLAGVSFSPEYSPGTTTEEMVRLAKAAGELGHSAFFHVRFSDPYPPGTSMEAVAEALQVGRQAGVGIHIEHITSTGGTFVMADTLRVLDEARAGGQDVTACLYPYDYWGTFLASSRFADGWTERFGLSYDDLQVAGTNRRLTKATYEQAWRENKLVAALGSIPEDEVLLALRESWTMVASDAILNPDLNNHPRAAGTFCRLLGRYVRDLGVLGLMDALAKITILPAQRVEHMLPAMTRKGRLQRGADADIVVFDPATVADKATVAAPNLASVGIDWVLVDGQVALRHGEPQRQVLAGRALRSSATT
jgi:N-acyl-D-aspartate/D-glutamate deacylase